MSDVTDECPRVQWESFEDRVLCEALETSRTEGDLDRLKRSERDTLSVFSQFLEDDIRDWKQLPAARIIVDFIAGMTDSFFNQAFVEFFLPRSTV